MRRPESRRPYSLANGWGGAATSAVVVIGFWRGGVIRHPGHRAEHDAVGRCLRNASTPTAYFAWRLVLALTLMRREMG